MEKYLLFFFISVVSLKLSAQEEPVKEPSKESEEYHSYRQELSWPSYSYEKVDKLIQQIKEGEEGSMQLNPKTYQALSLREKFTYHMIHGESYSQNCDGFPTVPDEHKKIFAQLPDAFGEYSWSNRQLKFFKNNRDSVMKFMKESISKTNQVGLNFKEAIVEMNAKEMIPLLISIYNLAKKDHDILTVLMLLMENNKYQPFLASASHKKLYGDDDDLPIYDSYLNYNKANEELIIKRATGFYNAVSK